MRARNSKSDSDSEKSAREFQKRADFWRFLTALHAFASSCHAVVHHASETMEATMREDFMKDLKVEAEEERIRWVQFFLKRSEDPLLIEKVDYTRYSNSAQRWRLR
jgi:hypothetical protein